MADDKELRRLEKDKAGAEKTEADALAKWRTANAKANLARANLDSYLVQEQEDKEKADVALAALEAARLQKEADEAHQRVLDRQEKLRRGAPKVNIREK